MRYFLNSLPDFTQGSSVQIDRELWKARTLGTVDSIVQAIKPKSGNCDGGLYVGCAGISYALYHVAKLESFDDRRADLLQKAKEYSDVSLEYAYKHGRDPKSSFLLGTAGVTAVASVINDVIGEKSTANYLAKKYGEYSQSLIPAENASELFVGRAGYICGSLFLNKHYKKDLYSDAQMLLCKSIIKAGRDYARRHNTPSPLMYEYYGTEYLGAAHGLSGILQMVLSCPHALHDDPSMNQDVQTCVDFMLSLMQPNGNIAPAMDEVGHSNRRAEDELVHWCHGAPGVVYLFARAYLVYKDDKYLQACLRCGELTWTAGLLRKGPGICHGVAGSGYVFLLLYRLTGDEKHLHRAVQFGEFLFSKEFKSKARTPDCPYSLYEGLAGTACFLADILHPEQAEFPFFDVFF